MEPIFARARIHVQSPDGAWIELAGSIQRLTDELFPPPTEPREFLRYCWRVYGTGRTEPDADRRGLNLLDGGLLLDLKHTGLSNLPLPWPEFDCRAKAFFRSRYARKCAVRLAARAFRAFDESIRRCVIAQLDEFEAAIREVNELFCPSGAPRDVR